MAIHFALNRSKNVAVCFVCSAVKQRSYSLVLRRRHQLVATSTERSAYLMQRSFDRWCPLLRFFIFWFSAFQVRSPMTPFSRMSGSLLQLVVISHSGNRT